MIPRLATPAEALYWARREDMAQSVVVIGGPEEGSDVIPCPALISESRVVHVAYQLDEIELAHLANGGTLWMSTWGGLPVHLLEVVAGGSPETSHEQEVRT